MKFELIEWNASDLRNKLQIESGVMHLNENRTLNNQKSIILMDEVDGMSGSDKGGIKCLIEMIKNTKVPIICICNDRYNQKIKSLSNYCKDIQFHKPKVNKILDLMINILQNEKISFNKENLEKIIA